MCEHCYFEIKYHRNDDGSKMACPGCRLSNWYALPNLYLRKMVKTLKIECPRYCCNSSIQNGDLITHLNSCVNSNPPNIIELEEYLKDFPNPKDFIKTFKCHEGLVISMKRYTDEKDWDYSYFLENFIHNY